jgi:hypothetical protein
LILKNFIIVLVFLTYICFQNGIVLIFSQQPIDRFCDRSYYLLESFANLLCKVSIFPSEALPKQASVRIFDILTAPTGTVIPKIALWASSFYDSAYLEEFPHPNRGAECTAAFQPELLPAGSAVDVSRGVTSRMPYGTQS